MIAAPRVESSRFAKRFGIVLGGLLVVAILAVEPVARARAADSAVVVMYHRFGESQHPSTNVTLEQFESHLGELRDGEYAVRSITEIVTALREGRALPERTLGLTVDDAFLSVYQVAWPRLREAGYPFTLFVATDAVDRGLGGYMNWDQIRELVSAGVTVGSQTASHLHMANADRERNRRDIERSNRRFVEELGQAPALFAYPYGEASLAVADLIRDAGFVAAFGQHSGVLGSSENEYFLPRFAMNETYGGIERFQLAVNALALPVTEITPEDPLIGDPNPPSIGFTVLAPLSGLDRLACYASHEGRASLERLGSSRFEARLRTPLPVGRTRLNCTMPTDSGRWRWFGRQFYVAP
jgi:peptidoglycan/xylan/chitin deacetylase (PgdA/CDA1 family)